MFQKWHESQDHKGKEPADLAWQKANSNWDPLKDAVELPQYATCLTSDAQAYAFKMAPADPLILACRGTSSVQDAMVDVSLQLVPFVFADGSPKTGVSVHRGFYEQFKGIMPQVDKLYRGHLAGGGTLLCIGHSLGSAVAALAALYYGQLYPGKVSYVGFGTPRVGNGEFVKLFNSVIKSPVRVANGRDPGLSSYFTCVTSTSYILAFTGTQKPPVRDAPVFCSEQDTSPGMLRPRLP